MNRKSFLALGLILIGGLTAGMIWATGTNAPAEEQTSPAELPQSELPVDPVPAEEVAFCPSVETCNTIACDSGGCYSEITPWVDLGFRCCLDHGELLQCPRGQTVHGGTGPCGGNASCPEVRQVYACR